MTNTTQKSDDFFDKLWLILSRVNLTPADKVVLTSILLRIGSNEDCWPGMDTIRKNCGLKSKGTVNTSLKKLEALGILEIIRPDRPAKGKSNHYSINLTGLKNEPVQKIDRFKNYTTGGSENEPVQKMNRSKKRTHTGLKNRLTPVQKIDCNRKENRKEKNTLYDYGDFFNSLRDRFDNPEVFSEFFEVCGKSEEVGKVYLDFVNHLTESGKQIQNPIGFALSLARHFKGAGLRSYTVKSKYPCNYGCSRKTNPAIASIPCSRGEHPTGRICLCKDHFWEYLKNVNTIGQVTE